ARAQARVAVAGSSMARGAPNTTSAASPRKLSTVPPCSETASTTTRKKRLSMSTTSAGSDSTAIRVEPMMSTKTTPTRESLPPSSGSRCSAAAATSRPTCRENSSRMRSRSCSPDAIWLNPRCSSPSSVPSKTTTRRENSPFLMSSIAHRTLRTGPSREPVASETRRYPARSEVALRTRTITDSRLSATGRPARVKIATMLSPTTGMPLPSAHETRTRVIAPMKRAGRGTAREGDRRQGTEPEVRVQERGSADHHPGEDHGEPDRRDGLGVDHAVGGGDDGRAEEPQERLDQGHAPRHAQGPDPLAGGRLVAEQVPLHPPQGDAARPDEADHRRERDVDGDDDGRGHEEFRRQQGRPGQDEEDEDRRDRDAHQIRREQRGDEDQVEPHRTTAHGLVLPAEEDRAEFRSTQQGQV